MQASTQPASLHLFRPQSTHLQLAFSTSENNPSWDGVPVVLEGGHDSLHEFVLAARVGHSAEDGVQLR